MIEVTPKMRADAEALADRICGCANREQHRADVKAILEVMAKHQEAAIRAAIEAAAKVPEKRAEERFAEHGTTEWDTNASYYSGRAAETYESLDEEDEDVAAAIRALSVEQIMKGMGE